MLVATLCCALFTFVQAAEASLVRETYANGTTAEFQVQVTKDGVTRRHGTFKLEAQNGETLVLGEYQAGKRNDRWRMRYEDGRPWATGEYRSDKRLGEWTFQFPSREPQAEGKYSKGTPKGPWKIWTEDGAIDAVNSGEYGWIEDAELTHGLTATGLTLDGALHGSWTVRWPNGSRMLQADFTRGARSGDWHFWHVDGSYDRDFYAGEFPAPALRVPLMEDPWPLDAEAAAFAANSTPTTDVLNPTRIAELLPMDGAPGLGKLYADYRAAGAKPTETLLEELLSQGPGVLPHVLEELHGLDFDALDGQARARQLFEQLATPLCAGLALVEPNTSSADALRLAALRLHSIFILAGSSESWWSLDLALTSREDGQVPDPTLLSPPLPTASIFAGSDSEGLYSSRFASRDGLSREERKSLVRALDWLVAHQDEDGKWDCDEFMKHDARDDISDGPGFPEHDVGVTGLALLALLGDGNTMDVGPHKDSVVRAVGWLIQQQKPGESLIGQRLGYAFLYDHAIATLALSEACHASASNHLRETIERAVRYITAARNANAVWRYDVPPGGDNDSSVTAWMVMALCAAREAGIAVPPANLTLAAEWFDKMTDPSTGRVGYSAPGELSARVHDVNDHYPREGVEAITALALHCRFLLGQDPEEDTVMEAHANLLRDNLPIWDSESGLTNDLYYWFHGTLAMHFMGGKHAKAWDKALKTAVLNSQDRDGSWVPNGPWGHAGGRVYSTALMALMLETPKRYSRVPGGR